MSKSETNMPEPQESQAMKAGHIAQMSIAQMQEAIKERDRTIRRLQSEIELHKGCDIAKVPNTEPAPPEDRTKDAFDLAMESVLIHRQPAD
jgi:hypothetical protein